MNKINIGEVIKNLRKEKGITQEHLAEFIGVSIPAVSKWESGTTYPDITLLPILASYFDVSIDELMNYNSNISKEDILAISKECEMLSVEGKYEEAIALCEKYIKKYPSNYEMKFRLSLVFMITYVKVTDSEKQNTMIERTIEILKDIINNTNNMELKESALVQISTQYIVKQEPDKAEEAIKKIYKPAHNPSLMLAIIYMQQNKIMEARKLFQQNLCTAIYEAIASCFSLGASYSNDEDCIYKDLIDFDKAKKYMELSLAISEVIGDNTSKYNDYIILAQISLKIGDVKESIEYLSKMMECLREINLNDATNYNKLWCFDELDYNNSSLSMDRYETLVVSLNEGFKDIKDKPEFKCIIEELISLKTKNMK